MEGINLYKEYIQQCEVATGIIDTTVSQWQTEISSKLLIYKLMCSFNHLFNSVHKAQLKFCHVQEE